MKHTLQRSIYRLFRGLKKHYLSHQVRPDTKLFFGMVDIADKIMSPRRRESQSIWKHIYFMRFGVFPLFELKTSKKIAVDSHDHKWPRGTIADNSVNPRFNLKLYDYFDSRRDLKILDLGCSGGGFVRSFLEDGYTALGLEGSDASKRLRSAEWDTCPHHLFTCDITDAFQIVNLGSNDTLKFHCITMWEVLEHISEDKLGVLFDNIYRHLHDDGIFVGSIDMAPDGNPITGAIYHVTLHNKDWWLSKFSQAGLVPVPNNPFETTDYVRGHGLGLKDWDPVDGDGFHVVLKKS
jgi:2-polyprenyl-3-methyl-5-hydroxy-6-metoxy-1,4-benzoquinol methylase